MSASQPHLETLAFRYEVTVRLVVFASLSTIHTHLVESLPFSHHMAFPLYVFSHCITIIVTTAVTELTLTNANSNHTRTTGVTQQLTYPHLYSPTSALCSPTHPHSRRTHESTQSHLFANIYAPSITDTRTMANSVPSRIQPLHHAGNAAETKNDEKIKCCAVREADLASRWW